MCSSYICICKFYDARIYSLSRLNELVLFLVNDWTNLIKDLGPPFPLSQNISRLESFHRRSIISWIY